MVATRFVALYLMVSGGDHHEERTPSEGGTDDEDGGGEDPEINEVLPRFPLSLVSDIVVSQLIVQDIKASNRNALTTAHSRGHTAFRKIVLGDFSHPKVALLGKRCTRMATCVIDMFPESAMFAWETFSKEIKRLQSEGRGQSYIDALADISNDCDKREDLLRFVCDYSIFISSPLTIQPDGLWNTSCSSRHWKGGQGPYCPVFQSWEHGPG